MELCEAVHSPSGCVMARIRRGDNYDVSHSILQGQVIQLQYRSAFQNFSL